MRERILAIASQIRAEHIADVSEIWGADTRSIVIHETEHLSLDDLREAAGEFQKMKIHPAAQRDQMIEMIDTHLKHLAVKNLDPLTGRSIKLGCYR